MKVVHNFAEEALRVPVTIHGRDDAGIPLTLLDALTTHWGTPDGTGVAHVLQGSQAIVGAHVPDRNHLFTGIRVRLTKLRAWQPLLREPAWPSESVLAQGGTVAIQQPEASGTSGDPSLWISGRQLPPSTLRVPDRSFWQLCVPRIPSRALTSRVAHLQRMLAAEGVRVEWRPQARWADTAAENVALSLMASGAYDGIKAAVKRFQDPVADVDVVVEVAEDEAPDDSGFLDDWTRGIG